MTGEAAKLKALFARRDLIARRLAEVDRRIDVASIAYSDAQGYRIRPRVWTLRKEVGADNFNHEGK